MRRWATAGRGSYSHRPVQRTSTACIGRTKTEVLSWLGLATSGVAWFGAVVAAVWALLAYRLGRTHERNTEPDSAGAIGRPRASRTSSTSPHLEAEAQPIRTEAGGIIRALGERYLLGWRACATNHPSRARREQPGASAPALQPSGIVRLH